MLPVTCRIESDNVPPYQPPPQIQDALDPVPTTTGHEMEPSPAMATISEVDYQPPSDDQSLPSGRSAATPTKTAFAYLPPVYTVDMTASRSLSADATSTSASASGAASTSLVRRIWRKATSFRLPQRRQQAASSHSQMSANSRGAGDAVTRMATIHSVSSHEGSTCHDNPLGLGGRPERPAGSASAPLGHSDHLTPRAGSGSQGFHFSNVLDPAPEFAFGGPPSAAAVGGGGYMQVSNLVPGRRFAHSGTFSEASGGLSGALRRLNSSHRHSAHSGGIVPPESIADNVLRSEAEIAFDITDKLIHLLPAIPVRAIPPAPRMYPPAMRLLYHL